MSSIKKTNQRLTPGDFYGYPLSDWLLKKSVVVKAMTACDEAWLKENYFSCYHDPRCLEIIQNNIERLTEQTLAQIRIKKKELQSDLKRLSENFIPLIMRLNSSCSLNKNILSMVIRGHQLFDPTTKSTHVLFEEIADIVYENVQKTNDPKEIAEVIKKALLEKYLAEFVDHISLNFDEEFEEEMALSIRHKKEALLEIAAEFEKHFIPFMLMLKDSQQLDYEMIKMLTNGHQLFDPAKNEGALHLRDIAEKIFKLSKKTQDPLKLIRVVNKWLMTDYLLQNFDFSLNFPQRLRNYLKVYHEIMTSDPQLREKEFLRHSPEAIVSLTMHTEE